VILCALDEVEAKLDASAQEFELLGQSAYQVGIGFGAKVNVLLILKRIDPEIGK
jgi:hypothetical protein